MAMVQEPQEPEILGKRYRLQKRWFRRPLMVLQVKIKMEVVDGIADEGHVYTGWRDAHAEDFLPTTD